MTRFRQQKLDCIHLRHNEGCHQPKNNNYCLPEKIHRIAVNSIDDDGSLRFCITTKTTKKRFIAIRWNATTPGIWSTHRLHFGPVYKRTFQNGIKFVNYSEVHLLLILLVTLERKTASPETVVVILKVQKKTLTSKQASLS